MKDDSPTGPSLLAGRSLPNVVHRGILRTHSGNALVLNHRLLPLEILVMIFGFLALHDLITASHVSAFWRSICLDAAQLWCCVTWTERRPDALAVLLERSRNARLHLDLHFSLRESETDMAALRVASLHFARTTSLRISITIDKGIVARMHNSNSPLRLLNAAHSLTRWLTSPAPVLERLSLRIHPQCFYVHLPRNLLHSNAPKLASVQLSGNFFGAPCFHRPFPIAHPVVLRHARHLELAATDSLELLLALSQHFTSLEDLVLLDGARKRGRVHGSAVSHPITQISMRRLILRLAHRDLTPLLARFSLTSVTCLHLTFCPMIFSALADTGIFMGEHHTLRRLAVDRGRSARARGRLTLRYGEADTRLIVIEDVPYDMSSFIRGRAFDHVTHLSMHEHAFVHVDLPNLTSLHLRLDPPYTAEIPSVFEWAQTNRKPLFVLPGLFELTVSAPVMRLDIAQLDVLLLMQRTICYTSKKLQCIQLSNISCCSGTEHWRQLCRAARRLILAPVSIDGRRQFAQAILDGCIEEQTRLDCI